MSELKIIIDFKIKSSEFFEVKDTWETKSDENAWDSLSFNDVFNCLSSTYFQRDWRSIVWAFHKSEDLLRLKIMNHYLS